MAAIPERRLDSNPRKTSGGGDAFQKNDPRLQLDHVWPLGYRRGHIEIRFPDRTVVYKESSNFPPSSYHQLTFLKLIKTHRITGTTKKTSAISKCTSSPLYRLLPAFPL